MKKNLLPLTILIAIVLLLISIPLPSHAQDYGLVPCGVDRDNPDTPNWDETEDCALKHTLLLVKNLVDFALWKLSLVIIVLLTMATGAIFYFSLGNVNTLVLVRKIWRAVILGVVILLFSWLFLNFLLGILGFDISVFGRWYKIVV